ncbi:MAG: hypothetical protein FJ267_06770, partial [Planctomycetes bacterium]|nr:hypothetical protein [Planctomycetota bacterium]
MSRMKNAARLAAVRHAEESSNRSKPLPPPRPISSSFGDEKLIRGKYEAALQFYRSMELGDSLHETEEILLRMALCEEGLGKTEEALEMYRSIVATEQNEHLVQAATIGQIRIHLQQNNLTSAEPLIQSILLKSPDDPDYPTQAIHEFQCFLAIGLVNEFTTTDVQFAPLNQELVGANPDLSLSDACRWSVLDRPKYDKSPDNHSADDSLRTTPQNRQTSDHRVPPSLLMKLLEMQIDSQWKTTSEPANDSTSDQSESQARGDAAIRSTIASTIKELIDTNPKHRLAPYCRFAIGQIAMSDGDLIEAASQFSSLVDRKTSLTPLSIRAAYNAGVCYFRLADRENAIRRLEVIVHGAPGHELHSRTVILYGRMLLEMGDYREAAFQLRRATKPPHLPEDQARASVYLAMAQMMRDKPKDAATALFAQKYHFDEKTPPVKLAAAFLNSLAKFQHDSEEVKRTEGTFLYRAILAVEPESDWLGPTGKLLIGRAYREIGMEDLMENLYLESLRLDLPPLMMSEMKFSIATHQFEKGNLEAATQMWTELSQSDHNIWEIRSHIKLAEMAFNQGKFADCVEICRALEGRPELDSIHTLRLMGRAYERLNQNTSAALCYAGKWPGPLSGKD